MFILSIWLFPCLRFIIDQFVVNFYSRHQSKLISVVFFFFANSSSKSKQKFEKHWYVQSLYQPDTFIYWGYVQVKIWNVNTINTDASTLYVWVLGISPTSLRIITYVKCRSNNIWEMREAMCDFVDGYCLRCVCVFVCCWDHICTSASGHVILFRTNYVAVYDVLTQSTTKKCYIFRQPFVPWWERLFVCKSGRKSKQNV